VTLALVIVYRRVFWQALDEQNFCFFIRGFRGTNLPQHWQVKVKIMIANFLKAKDCRFYQGRKRWYRFLPLAGISLVRR
jgi:hypothetical protein